MKIKDKKTGEVIELKLVQTNCECLAEHEIETLYGEEISLETLNKFCEDYEQKEPLIKDEKLRKAVRAWAESNGISNVVYDRSDNSLDDSYRNTITFNQWLDLKDDNSYTIAELCGEEEE